MNSQNRKSEKPIYQVEEKKDWTTRIVFACIVLLGIFYFVHKSSKHMKDEDSLVEKVQSAVLIENESDNICDEQPTDEQGVSFAAKELDDATLMDIDATELVPERTEVIPEAVEQKTTSHTSSNKREKTTLEILEERNHERVVNDAKKAGVSTEGSTIDILERINHQRVVNDAKKAGVSTEGSTIDILERINHQRVVNDAKKAGVSTEGSTTDILERIMRKQMGN